MDREMKEKAVAIRVDIEDKLEREGTKLEHGWGAYYQKIVSAPHMVGAPGAY